MADVVAGPVVEKVVDSLYVLAKKKIGYMWNCKQNVENLEKEVKSLEVMTRQVQQQIGIAKDKGDNLIVGVEEWLKNTSNEISKAEVFLGEFLNAKKSCYKIGMCGNWATLYHYGKGAMEMMTPLKEHKESGTHFVTCVSVETLPPTQLDVYQTKNLENLFTHNSALNAIIAALDDESKQIIGIYGLGGVGKTTLAMEVAARVKKTNMLFAHVAFTTVSQNIDVDKIKKDIEEATKRIVKGDKVLIILDDVWEKLNLEELCIPYGNDYMNCKILLTSRSEKVCQKMNAQSKICVNSLLREEAWILFKRVVGERVETDANLKPVALKVVEECGGLPLLIQAVGNALKDERIESWSWALTQLQKHAPSDIDEEIRKSFIHLKLSYDYLKREEAKSCFLLCSMFPEDCDILLEDLVIYGVGLERFDDLDSIEDARGRVQNAVNILTSSGLLLNNKQEGCTKMHDVELEYLVRYGVGLGKYDDQNSIEDARGRVQNAVNILTSSGLLLNLEDDEGFTKMHDVVRDVALLIASQGNNKFLVEAGHGLTEWLPRNKRLESYMGISLIRNVINKLPEYKVDVPDLEIFLVQENHNLSKISDEFIGCMKNLKVLDISSNDISSLPQSFGLLTKLRMLNLSKNRSLQDISILGVLRDLEILNVNETGIIEIPKEIAQLVNLRVLQVNDCVALSRITKGVIPALSMLEELCIDLRHIGEGVNGCIGEVMKLLMLTYLELKVERFDLIPEGFNLENLKGFEVETRNILENVMLRRSDRSLEISTQHSMIPLLKWLKKLIVVSRPPIRLIEIRNLTNLMPTLYDEGFNELEHIELIMCRNVSCLVDDGIKRCDGVEGKTEEKFFKDLKDLVLWHLYKLEVLWKCPDEYISLTNLVTLYIESCDKLKRVFTVRVAQGLINLKKLDIKGCCGLKEVIWGGEDDDQSINVIVFPSLAEISFDELTSLKSFYPGYFNIKYPSLVEVKIDACESMEIWGPGIHETPNLKTLVGNYGVPIVVDGPFAINKAVEKSFKNRQVDDDDDE